MLMLIRVFFSRPSMSCYL